MKKSEKFIKEIEKLREYQLNMFDACLEDEPLPYLAMGEYQAKLFMLDNVIKIFNDIYNRGM